MSEYQLQIKQIVDYTRCRVYRKFVQSLINDRSIRISGGSGLFVLRSFAATRTSVPRTAGLTVSVIRSIPASGLPQQKSSSQWFRTRFHWQAIEILEKL